MSPGADDEDVDEDVDVEPSGRSGLVERLLPPINRLGDDGQPKPSRMDHREQLVTAGLGFANVAIAAGAAAAVQRQQGLVLLAGVIASAVTVTGARIGNRIVAILGLFACVVTRNSDTVAFLAFAVPYYGASIWILLRYNRQVKAQAILRRQQRAAARGATTATGARTTGKGSTAASTAKGRPSPSKRYTPPKAGKKRPPPPPKPPRDRSIVD